jgi:hypothetical protein
VSQLDNYARPTAAHLPELTIRGITGPVLEVVAEANGETIYMLRLPGLKWCPHVFAPGLYTLRVTDPESGKRLELKGIAATKDNRATLEVAL